MEKMQEYRNIYLKISIKALHVDKLHFNFTGIGNQTVNFVNSFKIEEIA